MWVGDLGSSLQLPNVRNQRITKALSKKPSEVPWLRPTSTPSIPWLPDNALLPGSRPHRWSYCTPAGIQRWPPPGRCSGKSCTHQSSDSSRAGTRGTMVRPPKHPDPLTSPLTSAHKLSALWGVGNPASHSCPEPSP